MFNTMNVFSNSNLRPYTVAFYNFDNNGLDRSNNKYNLSINGTIPYSNTTGTVNSQYSVGPFSVGNYFTLPTSLKTRLVAANFYCIEYDAYIPAIPISSAVIFSTQISNAIGISGTDKSRFATAGSNLVGNITLSTSTQYRFAFTWDGTNKKIFVNGVLDVQSATSGAFADETMAIGLYPNVPTFFFNGQLDNFRISIYPNAASVPTSFPQRF